MWRHKRLGHIHLLSYTSDRQFERLETSEKENGFKKNGLPSFRKCCARASSSVNSYQVLSSILKYICIYQLGMTNILLFPIVQGYFRFPLVNYGKTTYLLENKRRSCS